MKEWLKGDKLIYLSTGVLALIIILSLFVFQFGVSDNGELTERLLHLGMYDAQGASARGEFATLFGVSGSTMPVSTADFVYLLPKLFVPVDFVISAFVPALIYSILILIGFYLILKSLIGKNDLNNILLAVLLILIIADTGYLSFLNTPYIDAAVFSYSVFALGAFLWSTKNDKVLPIIIAGVGAILFSGASKITAMIGVFLGIYFIRLLFAKKKAFTKVTCILFSLITIFTSVFTVYSYPVNESHLFNSVFYGVALNDSKYAKELGFDADTASKLSGKSSFDEISSQYIENKVVSRTTSYNDISMLYLKNPSLMIKNMKQTAMNSTMISTDYLGNYKYGSGKGYQNTNFFKFYSTLKRRLLPANLLIISLLFMAYIAGIVFYRKNYSEDTSSKLICDLSALAVIGAIIAFFIPLVESGFSHIAFNLHTFNLMFDLCLLSAVIGGIKLLWKRREILKTKYGVNQ